MSTTTTPARTTRADAPRQNKPANFGRAPSDTPGSWLTYVILTLAVLFFVFPLYYMFVGGSGTEADLADMRMVPGGEIVANAKEVLTLEGVNFLNAMWNSLWISAVVTASQLFFCSLAGFAFAKLRFKGRNGLLLFLVGTMTIPSQLGVVALYILFRKLPYPGDDSDQGWNTQLIAVVVPTLVTAFGVFYMRQFIEDAIPDELIEAGRVDGASTFRTFVSIVVPTLRPAFGVLGLLTFCATWNDFVWPLVTLNGEHRTVQVALSTLATGQTVPWPRVFMGSTLATLPLLIIFFVAGKQIVGGIMEGAVKS
ncbi:MAG: carbohydrate ABC transporter permease [Kineosporiaceae bacterium]